MTNRPEYDNCRGCGELLTEYEEVADDTWLFCLDRAHKVMVATWRCLKPGCNTINHFDGCTAHIFNSNGGSLWQHALLNQKRNTIRDPGVTGCAWIETMRGESLDVYDRSSIGLG